MKTSTTHFKNEKFTARFEKLVAETGETQKQIARAAGLSEGAITNYLNGRAPRWPEALKLARAFGVTPAYLLGWENTLAGAGAPVATARLLALVEAAQTALGRAKPDLAAASRALASLSRDLGGKPGGKGRAAKR